jgi:hypothetical protein
MSTVLYSKWTAAAESDATIRLHADGEGDPAQRASALAQRLAALVPAEVLVIYGFALAATVTTKEDGTSTVTEPDVLRWSIPILAVMSIAAFVLTKTTKWRYPHDVVRMLIPPLAFVAWTLLTGSTALGLWGWFAWIVGLELYVGGLAGAVALMLAVRYTAKSKQ